MRRLLLGISHHKRHGERYVRWQEFALVILILLVPMGNVQGEEKDGSQPVVTDQTIALAVEREIRADGVVSIDPIDISVNDGIVTFEGTVNNLLAKERAATLAETIKGVRSVVNQLRVIPTQSDSDSAIQERVIEELSTLPQLTPAAWHVSVADGVVLLDGPVNSWHEKFLAGETVKRVQGVRGLDNQLFNKDPEKRPDADIKQEIVKRLQYDVWVPAEALDVTVKEGKVTLTGTVGSAYAKKQALQHAWSEGVHDVHVDGLKVDPDFKPALKRDSPKQAASPESLREAVIYAISYDPRVQDLPQVDVRGGVVTLSGQVDNLLAKRAAEEDAENTAGVWYVRNYLKVRPTDSLSDLEIQRRIQDALKRNPYLTRWNINVRVFDGGVVYLAGRVGTFFEKQEAEEISARAKGVTNVLNRLRVDRPRLKKDDAEIREDVKIQLWWSPFVDSDSISVSVDDGQVTLEGTVGSWQEWRLATKNAYEGGARKVVNKLTVENFNKREIFGKKGKPFSHVRPV